jgi:hypothetical protein
MGGYGEKDMRVAPTLDRYRGATRPIRNAVQALGYVACGRFIQLAT